MTVAAQGAVALSGDTALVGEYLATPVLHCPAATIAIRISKRIASRIRVISSVPLSE